MGLGIANQGFSPFDIFFRYVADDETVTEVVEPFDPKAVPCNQPISVSSFFSNLSHSESRGIQLGSKNE